MRKKRQISVSLKQIVFLLITNLILLFILSILKKYPRPTIISNTILQYNFLRKQELPWPPLKIYVYPKNKYHTDECLYPPEMPNRYINETNYWFQRMLEPTVYEQLLQSPIISDNANESDMFFIPHFSRMCSGLPGDDGKRWRDIPRYLRETGPFFERYGQVDHIIIHSVPQYGDKPADKSVLFSRSPIILLLDFKVTKMKGDPWTFSKSSIVPFITIPMKQNEVIGERNISAFVAMSTSSKGLRARSAELRRSIESKLKNVSNSKVLTIIRNNYSSFKFAIDNLQKYMSSSELCIVPPGDAPSSKRFYDAINALCVPYLISDYFFLPYEGSAFDYDEFIFQLSSKKLYLLDKNLNDLIQNKKYLIKQKRKKLNYMKERFTWNYKEKPKSGEALWTLTWSLYDKHRMMKPYLNNEMTGYENDYNFEFVF